MRSRQVCYIKRMISNTKKHLFKGYSYSSFFTLLRYVSMVVKYMHVYIMYIVYIVYIVYTVYIYYELSLFFNVLRILGKVKTTPLASPTNAALIVGSI